MNHELSVELLEATHQFPGPYVFKVVGASDENFVGRVVAAVRSQLPDDVEPAISIRRTAQGRHTCVTIEPQLENAAAVIGMYAHLRSVTGVVMLF